MAYAGFPDTFAEVVDDFSNINDHGAEGVLWCGGCLELPDDPILTSCLHLYCTECFTAMLVSARGADGRCSGTISCEVYECPGFELASGYRQLSVNQFQRLADSVGVIVQDPTSLFGAFPESGFLDDAIAYDGMANQQDDVAALWRSVDPNFDRSPAHFIRTSMGRMRNPPAMLNMVNVADRTVEEDDLDGMNDDDDDWDWEDDRIEYGTLLSTTSSRSEDYDGYNTATEDEEEDEDSDDELGNRPFVVDDDAPIPGPRRYILDSDSEGSGDESGSDSDAVSDVSASEAPVLRRDWPVEWRQGLRRPPRPLTRAQQENLLRNGWSCHGLPIP